MDLRSRVRRAGDRQRTVGDIDKKWVRHPERAGDPNYEPLVPEMDILFEGYGRFPDRYRFDKRYFVRKRA